MFINYSNYNTYISMNTLLISCKRSTDHIANFTCMARISLAKGIFAILSELRLLLQVAITSALTRVVRGTDNKTTCICKFKWFQFQLERLCGVVWWWWCGGGGVVVWCGVVCSKCGRGLEWVRMESGTRIELQVSNATWSHKVPHQCPTKSPPPSSSSPNTYLCLQCDISQQNDRTTQRTIASIAT